MHEKMEKRRVLESAKIRKMNLKRKRYIEKEKRIEIKNWLIYRKRVGKQAERSKRANESERKREREFYFKAGREETEKETKGRDQKKERILSPSTAPPFLKGTLHILSIAPPFYFFSHLSKGASISFRLPAHSLLSCSRWLLWWSPQHLDFLSPLVLITISRLILVF